MTIDESLALLGLPASVTRRWHEQLAEPQRHYHTLSHIAAMLDHYRGSHTGFVAAIWLHDIVYDPTRPDNEERSAEQARHDLPPGDSADLAIRLILDSKHHAGGDPWTDAFNDLDLGILGTEAQVYDTYAANIRREYHFVPEAAYRSGRAALLRQFNTRQIYKTPEFQHLEAIAHSNLDREIAKLEAPQSTL